MVAARQAMLDRCLVSVLQCGPPLSESGPLLAFLAPVDPHWEPPLQQQPPPSPAHSGSGREGTTAEPLQRQAGSSGPGSTTSSADAGNRYTRMCDVSLTVSVIQAQKNGRCACALQLEESRQVLKECCYVKALLRGCMLVFDCDVEVCTGLLSISGMACAGMAAWSGC